MGLPLAWAYHGILLLCEARLREERHGVYFIILIDAYTAHGTTVTVGQNRHGRQVMAPWQCESEIVDSTEKLLMKNVA